MQIIIGIYTVSAVWMISVLAVNTLLLKRSKHSKWWNSRICNLISSEKIEDYPNLNLLQQTN